MFELGALEGCDDGSVLAQHVSQILRNNQPLALAFFVGNRNLNHVIRDRRIYSDGGIGDERPRGRRPNKQSGI